MEITRKTIIITRYETLDELKSLPDGVVVEVGCKYADGYVDWYNEYTKTSDGLLDTFAQKVIPWKMVADGWEEDTVMRPA